MEHSASESEKPRMAQESDYAFRQAWALCPYSPEAVFRYVNLLETQKRTSDALLIAETAVRLPSAHGSVDKKQLEDLVQRLKQAPAQLSPAKIARIDIRHVGSPAVSDELV